MWERLCDILDAIPGRQVLVVGDFMLDRYTYGDAQRISPEAPVPVLRVVRQNHALGGSGSVAADIAALGATAHCVGIIGDDADGRMIEQQLKTQGAETAGLIVMPDRPTTRKTRLVGLAQHRHRQQLIRIDEECTEPVDGAVVERLLAHVERAMPQCQAVCIEDYSKGVVTRALVLGVVAAARKHRRPVLVDPAAVRDYSNYEGATVVTPNRSETELVSGVKLPDAEAVRRAATRIHAACRCEYVCVTLDAEGAVLIDPTGRCEHLATKPRDVYDVTGAGDEVLAALAASVAAGATMREAVMIANLAGGLEVEKFGCVPVRREEIVGEILLEHHKDLGKIRTVSQMTAELARRRQRGESVVFTNGCFDLLHVGHVATLKFSRQQGDLVIVGLNSDASVRRQGKGADRPINSEGDRAQVLAALQDVDYVVIFDEDTPERLIEAIVPDVLVKGQDWEGKAVAGQAVVEKAGGRVVFAPLVEGRGTTATLHRLREGRPQRVE